MKKYPFKFLDSYYSEDKDIFFGRDEEINILYEMVFQSSLILIYGASGTGKTSLINCGLAGKFQPHDWLPVLIRRGNNINDSLEKALYEAGGKMSAIPDDIIWLNDWPHEAAATTLSPIGKSIKAVWQRSFKPIYLIFDQFEELFILGTAIEQKIFFKTILEIIRTEELVKLIFSIREEYLGHLFDFEKVVPQLMRNKLRIEAMNLEKIKQVIIGATKYENSNIRLKVDESNEIAEGIFDKIKGGEKLLTIQLPFLQVFLDKFYLKITGDESRVAEAEFTMQLLGEMREINDVLINFLNEQVACISNRLNTKYPLLTPEMTWKILSPFSTLDGTKEPISKQGLYDRLQNQDRAMINETIEAFINSRILRYNDAIDLFELAHDSLAKPIAEKRSIEETTQLEVKRLIKNQMSVKNEAREYFSARQLLFIEPFLENFKVSEEEKGWIVESRLHIQEQQRDQQEQLVKLQEARDTKKRLRIVYRLLGIALFAILIALFFGIIARKQYKVAEKLRYEAIKEKIDALKQRSEAENAKNNALRSDSLIKITLELVDKSRKEAVLNLEKFKEERDEKDKLEVSNLLGRVAIISESDVCPNDLLSEIKKILDRHGNDRQWVNFRDSVSKENEKCEETYRGEVPISNYSQAIYSGDKAFERRDYEKAIRYYTVAEAFDPVKRDLVKQKIKMVFDAIKK